MEQGSHSDWPNFADRQSAVPSDRSGSSRLSACSVPDIVKVRVCNMRVRTEHEERSGLQFDVARDSIQADVFGNAKDERGGMAWTYLIMAGLLEIGWSIGLRYTDGFTKLVPSVLTIIAICFSVYLVSLAARTLPIGTAYAVWVGIGATGAALVGIYFLGESASGPRLGCLALIVLGVVGLRIVDG